ncbi:MAG TPA: non-ribosomal peptide synthetase [Acidimicrobiales bacterium]|nr:non-ribosomal peptide synthetase [Acidimicrobiales bacterium]
MTADTLNDEQRRRVLVEFNANSRPFESERCIHQLVADRVAANPSAIAVEFANDKLTYADLDLASNQLAHRLIEAGVGPGVIVGVCLEPSFEVVVALLAILKAGGAYLPLDPTYPSEHLQFMRDDSQMAVLVTVSGLADELANRLDTVVLLDEGSLSHFATFTQAPPSVTTSRDAAYVIYTSGSTGRPKGVVVAHQSVVNLAAVVTDVFELDAQSRVLQFASFAFDASVTEILVPLTVGATVCLAPREALVSGHELVRLLHEQRISVVTLPPSLLAVLPEAELPHLATLCSAGEACHPDLVRRWGRGRRFVNGYGPTEATVATAYFVMEEEPPEGATSVPIGAPIANVQVYVLDPDGQPLPIGSPGEIYIGGVGVARGYHNRPELNVERFVPDPFSHRPGARLFRSGDRGSWRADGTLDFHGRLDQQVKLRGFRIELGEIEQTLKAEPAVSDAVVVVREDTPGNRRLVGYVVPHTGADGDDRGQLGALLTDELRRRLPRHMVPAALVVLDAFPLSPNGKIDRRALPEPVRNRSESMDDAPETATPIEQLVAELWCELLGIDHLGLHEDLFEAGVDSLMATKAAGRFRAEFGVELAIPIIFENPTVVGIALALLAEMSAEGIDGEIATAGSM